MNIRTDGKTKLSDSKFRGFSPETIDFLWGIRFNNNREWFAEHKAQYQNALLAPMKALAAEVGAAFAHIDGLDMHISRIYRDMRMHPSTFYKDSLWFCLQRKRRGGVLENPCLCFEVRPEGYRFGFLLWCARVQQMDDLRVKIGDHADEFLTLVRCAEKETGIALEGDRYVRPKPCADERLQSYVSLKNFAALRDCPPDDLLFSPALADEVTRVLTAWQPLEEFCCI